MEGLKETKNFNPQHIFLQGCAEEYVNSNAFGLESAQVLPTPLGIKVLCLFYVDEVHGGSYV